MKLLLVLPLLFLVACKSIESLPSPVITPISNQPATSSTTTVKEDFTPILKWNNPFWDKYLIDAINAADWSGVRNPCKKSTIQVCIAVLAVSIAKRESNYKPETLYKESGDLEGVISRGLFQISIDSANQKAYSCGIKKATDLHDPKTNIYCFVKILNYQARKTGALIDGTKNVGCGKYWSVCRDKDGVGSYEYIMWELKLW